MPETAVVTRRKTTRKPMENFRPMVDPAWVRVMGLVAFAVFVYLRQRTANGEGYCPVGVRKIAEDLGLSQRAVVSALQKLRYDLGYVSRVIMDVPYRGWTVSREVYVTYDPALPPEKRDKPRDHGSYNLAAPIFAAARNAAPDNVPAARNAAHKRKGCFAAEKEKEPERYKGAQSAPSDSSETAQFTGNAGADDDNDFGQPMKAPGIVHLDDDFMPPPWNEATDGPAAIAAAVEALRLRLERDPSLPRETESPRRSRRRSDTKSGRRHADSRS